MTNEEIHKVVKRAQELGSYEQLDQYEKVMLTAALKESRVANNTGIICQPMVQMHGVQSVCDRVCREVSWQDIVDLKITYFFLASELSLS